MTWEHAKLLKLNPIYGLIKLKRFKWLYKYFDYNKSAILIILLSAFGSIFLLAMGVTTWLDGRLIFASIIFISLALSICNVIFLLTTKRVKVSKANVAVICYLLSASLFITGGKDGTGILWTYPLMAAAISMLSVRIGIILCAFYVATITFMFVYAHAFSWLYIYDTSEFSRFIFSSLAFFMICLVLNNTQETMYTRLQTKSITDSLTGLFNRSVIKNKVIKGSRRRYYKDSALLLIDIDKFKAINDTLGHDIGDEALVLLSERLKETIRSDDLAVRWGGEEFLVLLHHTTISNAENKANTIRILVENDEEISNLIGQKMTVSIGIDQLANNNFYQALKNADRCLYEAKNNGRNCVVTVDTIAI